MRRLRLLLLAPTVAPLLLVGTPAQAAPPLPGHCVGPFEAYTLPELIQFGESRGFDASRVTPVFNRINVNGDAIVCVKPVTNPSTDKRQSAPANVIDNVPLG